MKLLVVGTSGQLGTKLAGLARREGHQVCGTYKSRSPKDESSESFQLDKTDQTRARELMQSLRPQVVVDTAALHNVDYCESHPDEALTVNRDGTHNLAAACRDVGAKFVFVSTDFVFDGSGAPYSEESRPAPLSAYGRSKLEGEMVTLSSSAANVVVRSSVVYSWVPATGLGQSSSGKPLNFAGWLISQLNLQRELRIVNDQISSPTLADDLARATLSIITAPRGGIFHAAGATPLSRYDFSVRVARKMGLSPQLIHPIGSAEFKQLATRPMNSSLRSDRIERELGYRMMSIDHALDQFASQARHGVVA